MATSTDGISAETSVQAVKRLAKREKASGMIISALGDSPSRVVSDVDYHPALMLKLLDDSYASNRTVCRVTVQARLYSMRYTIQDMIKYIDEFTSLFVQLEDMGKEVTIP